MTRRAQMFGWIVFVASAISFVASSLRNGDWIGLIGSLLFLLGCVVFIVPLLRR